MAHPSRPQSPWSCPASATTLAPTPPWLPSIPGHRTVNSPSPSTSPTCKPSLTRTGARHHLQCGFGRKPTTTINGAPPRHPRHVPTEAHTTLAYPSGGLTRHPASHTPDMYGGGGAAMADSHRGGATPRMHRHPTFTLRPCHTATFNSVSVLPHHIWRRPCRACRTASAAPPPPRPHRRPEDRAPQDPPIHTPTSTLFFGAKLSSYPPRPCMSFNHHGPDHITNFVQVSGTVGTATHRR